MRVKLWLSVMAGPSHPGFSPSASVMGRCLSSPPNGISRPGSCFRSWSTESPPHDACQMGSGEPIFGTWFRQGGGHQRTWRNCGGRPLGLWRSDRIDLLMKSH